MVVRVPLSKIDSNPFQDRRHYDEEALQDLAASIEKRGLLQPVAGRLVDEEGNLMPVAEMTLRSASALASFLDVHGRVQIAAGERRVRALRLLQDRRPEAFTHAEMILRPLTDEEMAVDVWVENHERQALSAIEEARGIQRRMEHFGWTQFDVAERLGVSRPYVSNKLRLLKLSDEAQGALQAGEISERQAMALVPAYELLAAREEDVRFAVRKTSAKSPEDLLALAIQGESSDRLREAAHHLGDMVELMNAGEKTHGDGAPVSVPAPSKPETRRDPVEPLSPNPAAPSPEPDPDPDPVSLRGPDPDPDSIEGWPIPMPDRVYRDLDAMTKAELEEVNKRFRQHLWYRYDDGWRVSGLKHEQLDHVKRQVQFHANLEACMMLSAEQADELHAWIRERTDGWYGRTHGVWQGRHQSGSSAYFAMEAVRDAEKLGFMVDEPMRRFRQIITRIAGAFCYDLFLDDLQNRALTNADPEATESADEEPIASEAAELVDLEA